MGISTSPRLRPSVCWQTPVYIQFTPLGTPDPPISLLLTASFRCPNRHHKCKIPKARPQPPLTPNVLLQKFSLVQEEAAPFSQLLRPSPLTPLLISHVLPAHNGISFLYCHAWNMAGFLLSSLLPGLSSAATVERSTAAPLHSAFLITWNTLCMFLTYPAYILPTEGMLHESKTFSLSFPAVSQHLEQGPAHLPSDTTTMCVCVAPLHLLRASSPSWGLSPVQAGSTQN